MTQDTPVFLIIILIYTENENSVKKVFRNNDCNIYLSTYRGYENSLIQTKLTKQHVKNSTQHTAVNCFVSSVFDASWALNSRSVAHQIIYTQQSHSISSVTLTAKRRQNKL